MNWVRWLLAALGSLLWAIGCDLILELSLPQTWPLSWWWSVFLGMLLIWCLIGFLVGLTGRLWVAFALTVTVCAFLAAVNHAKLDLLGTPVVPADLDYLRTPGFLLSMLPGSQIALGAAGVVTIPIVVLLAGRLIGKFFPRPSGRSWLCTRLALVVGCGLVLSQVPSFNQAGNPLRAAYDATGLTWATWEQTENYSENGFVGGLLYNMPTEAMTVPAGYSRATMAEIAQRYLDRAVSTNQDRANAIDDTNVVIVLSESFTDPTTLHGVTLARDPIPQTRQAIEDNWGGQALAAFYGTGTSTMEFQALSGQSISLYTPQLTTPYQQLLPGRDDFPSAVGWLKAQGHRTIAVHSYSAQMYHRPEVYDVLGFDDFVHDPGLQESTRLDRSPYISDHSAYAEVVHQLEASQQPALVHLVTMQNHVPTSEWYPDPIGVAGVSDGEAAAIGGYARGLEHSDQALDEFLEAITATGESTVVIFFGDHFPGIFSEPVKQANPGLRMRETPFFIWSTQRGPRRGLPLTSPTDFLPAALDRIDAPLPGYYELLREVATEVGVLDRDQVITPEGRTVGYADLTPKQTALVDDLRLVQYDFTVGERYALHALWY